MLRAMLRHCRLASGAPAGQSPLARACTPLARPLDGSRRPCASSPPTSTLRSYLRFCSTLLCPRRRARALLLPRSVAYVVALCGASSPV